LKKQHNEAIETLSIQHKKNIEDLTRFFEKRLEEDKIQMINMEKEKRKEVEEKERDYERKIKGFEEEKRKMKKEFEEVLRKKVKEEVAKKEEEMLEREQEITKGYEVKLKGLFEKMHGEYEDQLADYELQLHNYDAKIKEKDIESFEFKKNLELEIEKQKKNFYTISVQTDLYENNEILINHDNSSANPKEKDFIEEKNDKIFHEKAVNTEEEHNEFMDNELEEISLRFQSIVERKNQALRLKDQYIKDLQLQIDQMSETYIDISSLKQILSQ